MHNKNIFGFVLLHFILYDFLNTSTFLIVSSFFKIVIMSFISFTDDSWSASVAATLASLLVLLITISTSLSLLNPKKVQSRWSRKKVSLPVSGKGSDWSYQTKPLNDSMEIVGGGLGRSIWVPGSDADKCQQYPFDRSINTNACDQVYRNIMLQKNSVEIDVKGNDVAVAALKGSMFYSQLQTDDGFWPGDYGGPMFLLPGLVIACYITHVDLGIGRKQAMLRYIMNHQQEDGGWGTHIEGQSTMFGSTLNYTAARLLGLDKESTSAIQGRVFMHKYQGATSAPQWAKFWLSTLGVYEWNGVNPTPPELWMLPYWFPFHPGKMWCHCRMVYLPMSALFGERYVYDDATIDPVTISLRQELYPMKYESISWGSFSVRERIAPMDLYNPQSTLMTFANHLLHNTLENPWIRMIFYYPLHSLRESAVKFAHDYIHAEDIHTNWVDIGPVSKAFHIIANYSKYGPESPNFLRHVSRIDDYLWLAEDGMKMQGYNGSMFWDVCFAAHALASTLKVNKDHESNKIVRDCLLKASQFVDDMQVREDVIERDLYFRDKSHGGWPFSSRDHGWPISDCTAEGVKTVIILMSHSATDVTQERLEKAISIILDLQNTGTDNGWASYELNRGYNWYELLNPAQVFGDIMIDYSYVECTSSCTQALCEFASHFPKSALARKAIQAAKLGASFIVNKQRANGSFYGSWGVCFTYGAWFAVDGLLAAIQHAELDEKERLACENALLKNCEFMLGKQAADGGWGESVESCSVKEYVAMESQVVQTAWVLLGFAAIVEYSKKSDSELFDVKALDESSKRAAEFLKMRQLSNGDWAQECVSGVFNKTCAISYTAYRNVFPIWALARYALNVSSPN